MTAMNKLYGDITAAYLGSRDRSTSDGAWKAKAVEILAEFRRRSTPPFGVRRPATCEGGPPHWQNQRTN